MKRNANILVLVTGLLVLLGAPGIKAQQQQAPMQEQQQQAGGDPILQLNLSPEQREKIRSIREQTKAERASINERMREANIALDTALDADNPDEALVDQKLRDVAAAQAAQMRMRILTEVRIRRVLTLEQLGILRNLRQQARAERRGRLIENSNGQVQQGPDHARPRQNDRNSLRPLFPKRALQRRQQP